jgi:TIR domain
MADPVRVFVSHHHSPQEDAFTKRLVDDLKAASADVWVDDEGITSGDFVRKINQGLAGRQWLVLVMTPDALQSPWVQAEVDAALHQYTAGRMLGVIPFVAQACDERDIPPLWANLHRYDASRDYEPARDRLFMTLGRSVATTPHTTATRSSTPAFPTPPEQGARLEAVVGPRFGFISQAKALWLPPLLNACFLEVCFCLFGLLQLAMTATTFFATSALLIPAGWLLGWCMSGAGILLGRIALANQTIVVPVISTVLASTASLLIFSLYWSSIVSTNIVVWPLVGFFLSVSVSSLVFYTVSRAEKRHSSTE